jgi:hypothetical protein
VWAWPRPKSAVHRLAATRNVSRRLRKHQFSARYYFESDPPADPPDKRRFGYSRDKRFDCVQVVIALIVTPEGFPLAYQVMAGNTSDKTTLADWLKRIEKQYGKARRIWVMDWGIPTEEVLEQMRQSDSPVQYLVGTPKGRLSQYEKALLEKPWQEVRPGVKVKLLPQDHRKVCQSVPSFLRRWLPVRTALTCRPLLQLRGLRLAAGYYEPIRLPECQAALLVVAPPFLLGPRS